MCFGINFEVPNCYIWSYSPIAGVGSPKYLFSTGVSMISFFLKLIRLIKKKFDMQMMTARLKTNEIPWPIAQMVLQHHERMNGSGYPAGLSGEGILLESRILGVADVVEAMASHRPYRPALGIDKALQEISRNKGSFYDREVVEACLKLFEEKRFEFD